MSVTDVISGRIEGVNEHSWLAAGRLQEGLDIAHGGVEEVGAGRGDEA